MENMTTIPLFPASSNNSGINIIRWVIFHFLALRVGIINAIGQEKLILLLMEWERLVSPMDIE